MYRRSAKLLHFYLAVMCVGPKGGGGVLMVRTVCFVCVCASTASHCFTQSSAGFVLCLTGSLAPPTVAPLQPSDRPSSQLFKSMWMHLWCSDWQVGAWVPAVVLSWFTFSVQAFKHQPSLHFLLFSFCVQPFFCIPLSFFSLQINDLKHRMGASACLHSHTHSCWQIHYCRLFGAF